MIRWPVFRERAGFYDSSRARLTERIERQIGRSSYVIANADIHQTSFGIGPDIRCIVAARAGGGDLGPSQFIVESRHAANDELFGVEELFASGNQPARVPISEGHSLRRTTHPTSVIGRRLRAP